MTNRVSVLAGVAAALLLAMPAMAVPKLQLYIEGATYDDTEESWVLVGTGSFRLWVIGSRNGVFEDEDGNVELHEGAIFDVHLSAVFDTGLTPTLQFTPSTATLPGWTDPSTPSDPDEPPAGPAGPFDGGTPDLVGPPGPSSLPSHDEYGAGRTWFEWALGDFDTFDSPTGDFIQNFPSPSGTNAAQINVYDVLVSGLDPFDKVHFDAYGYVLTGGGKQKSVFAPFSHDARWEECELNQTNCTTVVAEPETVGLIGGALLAFALARRRFRLGQTTS